MIKILLGDHISLITDYHANGAYEKLKDNIELKYEEDYAIMVRTLNFESKNFKDNLIYLNEIEYNYLKKSKVYHNDLIMNKIANAGNVYLMPKIQKPVSLAMNLFLIRFKETVDPVYMFYIMKLNESYIKKFAKGTTTKTITKDAVRELEFTIHNLNEQNLIARFIRNIDDKIDLNNQINTELEAMAKTLYDYWFVQFDFPDENGKPYKSSGGKMVFDETLKREIPVGWEVKKLEALVSEINTGLNPRTHFKLGEGDNFYITIRNIEYGILNFADSCDRISDVSLQRIQKRSRLEKGDILFTSIEPVGKTYLLREKPINWNINESVFSIKPNYELVTSEFLFMLLSSFEMKLKCKNSSTGSIHKGIRINPLKAFCFSYAGVEIQKSFSDKIKPILDRIDLNQKQNQELAQLRDWLLPMLMNGQVRVVEKAADSNEELFAILAEPANADRKIKSAKKRTEQSDAFFKKVILGSHLIYSFYQEREFGHIKFMKLLYLCEQVGNMDLMTNYSKAAAGPFDKKTLASIERYIEDHNWFKINKEPYSFNGKTLERTFYTLTSKSTEYRKYYDSFFESDKAKIQKLFQLLEGANSRKCEIVATTFYAWKELMRNSVLINDAVLIRGFFDFHPKKGINFVEAHVRGELSWMRNNGIYPKI